MTLKKDRFPLGVIVYWPLKDKLSGMSMIVVKKQPINWIGRTQLRKALRGAREDDVCSFFFELKKVLFVLFKEKKEHLLLLYLFENCAQKDIAKNISWLLKEAIKSECWHVMRTLICNIISHENEPGEVELFDIDTGLKMNLAPCYMYSPITMGVYSEADFCNSQRMIQHLINYPLELESKYINLVNEFVNYCVISDILGLLSVLPEWQKEYWLKKMI